MEENTIIASVKSVILSFRCLKFIVPMILSDTLMLYKCLSRHFMLVKTSPQLLVSLLVAMLSLRSKVKFLQQSSDQNDTFLFI